MTDLQDAICDVLVGSRISSSLRNGPLHLAAEVIEPGSTSDWGTWCDPDHWGDYDKRLAKIIGWPQAFCRSIRGATGGLRREEDRRTLAISLFSQIEPSTNRDVSVPSLCQINGELWLHTHGWVCSPGCALAQAMKNALESFQGGQFLDEEVILRSASSHCLFPNLLRKDWDSPEREWASSAATHLLTVLCDPSQADHCGKSLEFTLLSIGRRKGGEAALVICHDLAWRFGLRGKPPHLWTDL